MAKLSLLKNSSGKQLFVFFILFLGFLSPNLTQAKKAERPSSRGITHNNRGVTALHQGDIDKAIFEFKTALELDPKYVEAMSNLGLAYRHKGRLADAIETLNKAIKLDMKFASPYSHLGLVYLDQGDHKKAIAEFKKAVRYNKKFADAYYNWALVHVDWYKKDRNQDHLRDAIPLFIQATSADSEHMWAHMQLANIYTTLKEYEKAILRYKVALEINPNLTEAWNSLAELYTITGKTLKAQQALNHALETNPDSAMGHLNMGNNYLKDGNVRMAVMEYNKVIEQDPTNELAYFNVGYAYYKFALDLKEQGNSNQASQAFNESVKAYQSALKLRPRYPEAAFNLGYNYQTQKNYTEAAKWYENTITIDKNFHRAYFSLGNMYQMMGQSQKAASSLCSFIKLKPQNLKEDLDTAKSMVKSLGGCP